MKESIIKISKPIPKVQTQPSDSELEPSLSQTQEISLPEELEEPEPEPIDIVEPVSMRFASTNSSGWKASDILREIRLDSFEMGGGD
ncbi:hypothetical protein [Scytonema sp. NUACC21]